MPRPEQIKADELQHALLRAISAAEERLGAEFDRPVLGSDYLRPPWIVGRVLRDFQDLEKAFETAEVIAESVSESPAVMRVDRDILVGFVERNRLRFPSTR